MHTFLFTAKKVGFLNRNTEQHAAKARFDRSKVGKGLV
jgi:hypothetical protein